MQKAADVRSGNRAALVFVVTNDEPVRVMLSQILKAAGLAVEFYTSGMAFLERPGLDCFGCLLLDASASGTNGLDVQACLNERRLALPAIFLYEYVDVPFIVAAVRSGVMDFVEKPFDGQYLLELVRKAITLGGERLDDDRSRQQVLARLNTLTPRECGVMELIVAGKTTPQIAGLLKTSRRTIDIHRDHLMEKMSTANVVDLVRMRLLVDGSPWPIRAWDCDQVEAPKYSVPVRRRAGVAKK